MDQTEADARNGTGYGKRLFTDSKTDEKLHFS